MMLTCLNQHRSAMAEWSKVVLHLKIAEHRFYSTTQLGVGVSLNFAAIIAEFPPRLN